MRNTYPNLTPGMVARVTRVGDLGLRASFALETTKACFVVLRGFLLCALLLLLFCAAVSRNSPVTSVARKARENLSSNLELFCRFLLQCFFFWRSRAEMAEEGGPYDDGDSPPHPTRHGGDYGVQSGFDGYADRENGDRKREVQCCLFYFLLFFVCYWLRFGRFSLQYPHVVFLEISLVSSFCWSLSLS